MIGISIVQLKDCGQLLGWRVSLVVPWRVCMCGVVECPPAAWASTLCPIINHIAGFLSGQVSCVEGQENWLHVVPLASALVKSLTELDLRWALLGCLCAVLVFFL